MPKDTGNAHLYVIYTMSGQEQIIQNILSRTIIEASPEKNSAQEQDVLFSADEEILFSPSASFHMRIRQKDRLIEKRLYPGYIFLNTANPVSFYNRVRHTNFFGAYGKYLRVLRNDFQLVQTGESNLEEQYRGYLAKITDEEEQMVLHLCAMERDEQGNLVQKKKKQIALEDLLTLEHAGMDISEFAVEPSGGAGRLQPRGKNGNKPDTDTRGRFFKVGMSHGVKVVKKGSQAGYRQPGDIRTIVLDGPLSGLEGQIIKVDEHRRTATVRTTLMHQQIDIQVPLAIIKSIEE